MLMNFNDYQNKSVLESIKKIKIIHNLLKLLNIKSMLFLKGQDSYVYVKSHGYNLEIKGIRIYAIANKIAFKIQNGPKDLPQGTPYLLDFEKVYGEVIDSYEKKDKKDKTDADIKAAEKVAEQFLQTLKEFFKKKTSSRMDKEKVSQINLGTDYSSLIYSKY